jgi:hypothetical protein
MILGCRRSDVAVPCGPYVMREGGGAFAKRDYDLRGAVDRVRDQSISEKCSGESVAAAIHIAGGGKGKHPSPRGLYSGGRARERSRKGEPLIDRGAALADVLAYAIEDGVYAEDDVDEDVGLINESIAWDEIEAQAQLDPGSVGQIAEGRRFSSIDDSLSLGAPVVFGMLVDDAYQSLGREPYAGCGTNPSGGHAQVIVGKINGLYLVLGSWGETWGDDGYAWLTPSAIAPGRSDVFDFYSIRKGVAL